MKNIIYIALLAICFPAFANLVPSDVYSRGMQTAQAFFRNPKAQCQFEMRSQEDQDIELANAWSVYCWTTTPKDSLTDIICTGRALLNSTGDSVLPEVVTHSSYASKTTAFSFPIGNCFERYNSLGDGGNNGYGQ